MRNLIRRMIFLPLLCSIGGGFLLAQTFPFPGPKNSGVSAPSVCTPVTGYLHCAELDIDATKVGGSNLTNWPLLTKIGSVPLTFSVGSIRNTNCYDVVYTSDQAGTSLINYKTTYCNKAANQVYSYVKVNASASVVTKYYASWDNVGITTDQSPGTPWIGSYLALWPFSDGTTLSTNDVTTNANNAVNHSATAVTQTIDGAAGLNGTNQFITGPAFTPSDITVSSWAYSTNFNQNMVIMANSINAQWQLWIEGGALKWRGASVGAPELSTGLPSDNNAHYIVATQIGTAAVLYVDGVVAASGPCVAIGTTGTSVDIGSFLAGAFWFFNGSIDDTRIVNTAISAGQVIAEYNNQKPVSDLLSIGGVN